LNASPSDRGQATWTILKVLEWTTAHFRDKGLLSPRLDAEVLIAHVLDRPRIELYTRFDQPLSADELVKIRNLVARRAKHEPVAHLVGEREFWSLAFEVTPDVLIPRPETETLVEAALEILKQHSAPVIVDVGTGSGCIAIALAHALPSATVWATDISPEACAVASRNAARHDVGDRVKVLQSDLMHRLSSELRADAICANLPYIPDRESSALPPDVRIFEPKLALFGGTDGLDLIRRLIPQTRSFLHSNAPLILEMAPNQAPLVAEELRQHHFRDVREVVDHDKSPRAVVGFYGIKD
jgi:release factor glutamine methyltransferase